MGLEPKPSAEAVTREQGVSKEKLREWEIELDILFARKGVGEEGRKKTKHRRFRLQSR